MYGNRINCQEDDDEMTMGEILARNLNGETFEEYQMRFMQELKSQVLEEDKMRRARERELFFGCDEVDDFETSEASDDYLKSHNVIEAEPRFEKVTLTMTSKIEEELNESLIVIQPAQ